MQATYIFVMMASIIGAAQSQSWAGTYTVNSGCSTSTCCCLSGQVTVASTSTNTYSFSSPVSGACSGATTASGSFTASGYTGSATLLSQAFTLSLSSDSKTITATNVGSPACSGTATKSAAIKQHSNIIILSSAIAFISIFISTHSNIWTNLQLLLSINYSMNYSNFFLFISFYTFTCFLLHPPPRLRFARLFTHFQIKDIPLATIVLKIIHQEYYNISSTDTDHIIFNDIRTYSIMIKLRRS